MSSILETAPALWDPTTGRIYTFMVPGPDPAGPLVSAWGRETLPELVALGRVSPESQILSQDEAFALMEDRSDSEIAAFGRERGRPILPDAQALDAIARLMSGNEWDTETIEAVAGLVTETGRTIADLNTP